MPGYNCGGSLYALYDDTLGVLLGIDELKKCGTRHPKLDEAILNITTELVSWGLEAESSFRACIFVPQFCHQILYNLDAERWKLGLGQSIEDVRKAFYAEFDNLRNVLLRSPDADLDRAKKFCLTLNSVGLAQSGVRISFLSVA